MGKKESVQGTNKVQGPDMSNKITVNGIEVSIKGKNKATYISLTDIAKLEKTTDPRFVVKNWMRSKETIALLGL
ncbi:MAG: KilA-N domain-containing protein [Fibromonadaceae bacterium]|nr:KilA-N domain-containing protein [Fibromonadaceae bacterium]